MDFNLDLLLCGSTSANSSSNTVQLSETNNDGYEKHMDSSGFTNYNYENPDFGITEFTDHNNYQVQNIGNNENTNQSDPVLNLLNELFPGHAKNEVVGNSDSEMKLEKLNADYESLKTKYDSKNKAYGAVKKQYAKCASDFAKLHEENKKNVLGYLDYSEKFDSLESKEPGYLAKIKALEEKAEQQRIDILAGKSRVEQLKELHEKRKAKVVSLQNTIDSMESGLSGKRKIISVLKSNSEIQSNNLSILASVIEGKRQLDSESRSIIKKFRKKENSGTTKKTEIECKNTSHPKKIVKTSGAATNSMIYHKAKSSVAKTSTTDIATSPIEFTAVMTPVIKAKASDITSSPIGFTAVMTPVNKAKASDFTSSPIGFTAVMTPVNKAKASDITSSPIEFADARTPVFKYPDAIIPVTKALTKSLNQLHTVRPLKRTYAKSTVKKAT